MLVEEDLKAGRIPCLVATSSLELGIDMGAVDLVIQVESPKSVARGLQRIGRAGHELGAVSKGRIFPKFRADLLESRGRRARDARRRDRGDADPAQPARRARAADRRDLRRRGDRASTSCTSSSARAYPFAELSRAQLENVLDMLAGRYPSDEFAELRPRIVWDRTGGTIRAREGARRLAVTNAGTIPDRGLFGVFLVDGGGRVGELDEEMVYEARAGQTFLLGASTWRIEEITRDRVLVSPAPGPARRGAVLEGRGRRPAVRARPEDRRRLARAVGARATTRRSRGCATSTTSTSAPRATCSRSCASRHDATGAVPSDRTIVVERFRDEIGDWRVCILSPFGGRVHAPWAMAIAARLRESLGVEAQSIWSDDGIALHFPDADAPPPIDELLIDPDEVEDLVVAELGDTALFGARFRENAARALLIPRRRPGERTPLWQQRLKAQSLLQVARKYGSFPVVLETYRECLQDVFDLPALRGAAARARRRAQLDLVEVETQSASPYSRVAALRLHRDLHVRGRHAAGRAARAGAVARPRPAARAARPGGAARPARRATRSSEVERQLQRRADDARRAARPAAPARRPARGRVRRRRSREPLLAERRAVLVRIAGEERLIAAEDAGRYRDALGAMPPSGLPDAFLEGGPDSLRQLVLRFAKGRGPFTTARGERALRPRRRRRSSPSSSATSCSCAASCGPAAPSASGATPTCCAACAARRSRRCGARSSRSSSEALARFLPVVARRSTAARRCARRSCRCRRCALPVALWESEVLPRRVPGYRPEHLDALCASGEVVWVGAGLDRVALYFREDAAVLGQVAGAPRAGGRGARRDPRGARRGALVLARPARRDGPRRRARRCRRCGISSGRAR